MKKLVILLAVFLISCGNSNISDKYEIIKEEKDYNFKTSRIEVRLDNVVSKEVLKKIAFQIKSERTVFKKLWISYYLPGQKIGNGAWAISNFKPSLELEILGANTKGYQKLKSTTVTGTVIHVWFDNDAITPNRIYLVKENDTIYVKTLFAKNKYANASERVEKITVSKMNGLTRYDYRNEYGEYYLVEKNGNLGLYDNEGKIKEAKRVK